MRKRGYALTTAAKIVLICFLLSFVGVLCGFSWRLYQEDVKWDRLIYPGIKINNIDLSGKDKNESIKTIEAEFVNPILSSRVIIKDQDRDYVIDCSKLIYDYDLLQVVDKAISYGKNLNIYKKHELIKEGAAENYNITFILREENLKGFLEALEKDINTSPANARIELKKDSTFAINREKTGRTLLIDKLKIDIINNLTQARHGDLVLQAPIQESKPYITADSLAKIDAVLSSFSTSFASSSEERAQNIQLAVDHINGKVLMPGETFSFNDSVGARTKERGFKDAPVIVDNKVESGIGGGICQVSSTLYNAVLKSGIKPSERRNHSLPASYVGLGLDATVSWDDIDFKFVNTLDYPLFIEGYTKNKELYINLFSNSSLAKRQYTIANDVYSKIKAPTEIIKDPNLKPGQTSLVKSGRDGYSVKVIRNIYEDGRFLGSEVISKDTYPALPSIVKVGK